MKLLNNFIDVLHHYADINPDKVAYRFLRNGEIDTENVTFSELNDTVRSLAAHLQDNQLYGERVLLLYNSGLTYLISILACFYAGAIAVPAYPPRNARNLSRLQSIIKDAGAKAVMTTAPVAKKIKELDNTDHAFQNIAWILAENPITNTPEDWYQPDITSNSLAYLQYTSGSTGTPKGVMVSHNNLMHNFASIYQLFEHTQDSRMVSWLPIFHDLGLIFGLLQPLYGGFSCIFMSPAAFLQRPFRWLKAMSDYKATTTGAPNFAYDFCIKKISEEQKSTLDLTHWQTALNGAEPVRTHTLNEFRDYFSSCGLKQNVLSPCYGLAEATLVVSGTPAKDAPINTSITTNSLEQHLAIECQDETEKCHSLPASGIPFDSQHTVIVDPSTKKLLSENEIGEIWVSGPSIALGYWQRKQETAETFNAQIINGDDDKYYLRTGDLGFLKSNALYITGRLKDVIIIRGRNLYPQDIELVSERSHKALRPTCAAAFSIEENDNEKLVIIQELDFKQSPDYEDVIYHIRQEIAEHFEIQPYAVVLIKPGTIHKTSSGKIQRRLMRQQFLDKTLSVIAQWQEVNTSQHHPEMVTADLTRQDIFDVATEQQPQLVASFLRANIAKVLELEENKIDTHQSLVGMGLDSLGAAMLIDTINSNLDITLPIAQLFENANVIKLTNNILVQLQTE